MQEASEHELKQGRFETQEGVEPDSITHDPSEQLRFVCLNTYLDERNPDAIKVLEKIHALILQGDKNFFRGEDGLIYVPQDYLEQLQAVEAQDDYICLNEHLDLQDGAVRQLLCGIKSLFNIENDDCDYYFVEGGDVFLARECLEELERCIPSSRRNTTGDDLSQYSAEQLLSKAFFLAMGSPSKTFNPYFVALKLHLHQHLCDAEVPEPESEEEQAPITFDSPTAQDDCLFEIEISATAPDDSAPQSESPTSGLHPFWSQQPAPAAQVSTTQKALPEREVKERTILRSSTSELEKKNDAFWEKKHRRSGSCGVDLIKRKSPFNTSGPGSPGGSYVR